MKNNEPQACKASLEDIKKSALAHYEELATQCHHWNSFISQAIMAYKEPPPPSTAIDIPLSAKTKEEIIKRGPWYLVQIGEGMEQVGREAMLRENVLDAMEEYAQRQRAPAIEGKREAIPHDIISFWDEVLNKAIHCPDQEKYDLWCYWMLRNGHPVYKIKIGNRHYKIGDFVQDRQIVSLFWKGGYWGFKDKRDWISWLPSEQEASVWDDGTDKYVYAPVEGKEEESGLDPDWEAKEIRKRIDEQKHSNPLLVNALIERAFVIGYFNRPTPPASIVDDIADCHLKEAWERCKPGLRLSPTPPAGAEGEGEIPEDIKAWISQNCPKWGGFGQNAVWKDGTRAMWRRMQEEVSRQVLLKDHCLRTMDDIKKAREKVESQFSAANAKIAELEQTIREQKEWINSHL